MQISSWRKAIGNELYILDTDSKVFDLFMLDPSLRGAIAKFARDRRANIALVAASESIYGYEWSETGRLKNVSDSWRTRVGKDKKAYSSLKDRLDISAGFKVGFLAISHASVMPVFKDERLASLLPFPLKRSIWKFPVIQGGSKIVTAAKVAIADWFDFAEINYFGSHGSSLISSRYLMFNSLFLNEHGKDLNVYLVSDSAFFSEGINRISYSELFERIGVRGHAEATDPSQFA